MLGELFDPQADFSIREHCRPHWSQVGAVVFLTFRTKDSIPKEVLQRWNREKNEWLAKRDQNPNGSHWRDVLPTLEQRTRNEFNKQFNRQREGFLDTCHGQCVLKRPELSKIVADSLLHFDGDRYRMGDFVIMPNHVHLLAAFKTEEAFKKQCYSWMHFAATQINRQLGQSGAFWQEEAFDHLVRSPQQYDFLRDYIADNPAKAGLPEGQYRYWKR